jgi:hypothetical protein
MLWGKCRASQRIPGTATERLTNQSLCYDHPLKNQKRLLPDIGETEPAYLW